MIDRTAETPLSEQKVLCFVPLHNAPNKHDVTGAFLPEAKKFVSLAAGGSEIVRFDNTLKFASRRNAVGKEIIKRHGKNFTSVAFFCHGWANGVQAGFTRRTAGKLGTLICDLVFAGRCVDSRGTVVVPLYCCSTGQDAEDRESEAAGTGATSFAHELATALSEKLPASYAPSRVVAHTTKGHTTRNPNVAIFDGEGRSGYLLQPDTSGKELKRWQRSWRKSLRGEVASLADLRFQFPYQVPSAVVWAVDIASGSM